MIPAFYFIEGFDVAPIGLGARPKMPAIFLACLALVLTVLLAGLNYDDPVWTGNKREVKRCDVQRWLRPRSWCLVVGLGTLQILRTVEAAAREEQAAQAARGEQPAREEQAEQEEQVELACSL